MSRFAESDWEATRRTQSHPDFARQRDLYLEAIRTGAIFAGLPHEDAIAIRGAFVRMYGEDNVGVVVGADK